MATRTKSTRSKPALAAKPARAADLIDYRPDSIVSRELIARATGIVTLFAFDAGQGLSEHTAPFDALVEVLEGEVEITIAGKRHRLVAGELILMPAKRPHALRALSPFKMVLTMIRS